MGKQKATLYRTQSIAAIFLSIYFLAAEHKQLD